MQVEWLVSGKELQRDLWVEDSVFSRNQMASGPNSYGLFFSVRSKANGADGIQRYSVSAEFRHLVDKKIDKVYRYYRPEVDLSDAIQAELERVITTFSADGFASDASEGNHGTFLFSRVRF